MFIKSVPGTGVCAVKVKAGMRKVRSRSTRATLLPFPSSEPRAPSIWWGRGIWRGEGDGEQGEAVRRENFQFPLFGVKWYWERRGEGPQGSDKRLRRGSWPAGLSSSCREATCTLWQGSFLRERDWEVGL